MTSNAVRLLAHIKSPRHIALSQLSTETPKQTFASFDNGISIGNYSPVT
jgi:hypothetical protein